VSKSSKPFAAIVCVCVCVLVKKKVRERERETDGKERDTPRHRVIERDKEITETTTYRDKVARTNRHIGII
jgi:hypothetical protein